MSIVILKSIAKYLEKHGADIMCSLSVMDENSNAYENYLLLKR